MIANEFQYNLTRSQAARFAQALHQMDGHAADTGEPFLIQRFDFVYGDTSGRLYSASRREVRRFRQAVRVIANRD